MVPKKSNQTQYWQSLINQSTIRFFILRVLWEKDSYGYILSKEVEDVSWGFCKPTESTLYPALADMEEKGLIRSSQVEARARTRKMYSITTEGKIAFRIAAKTWGRVIPAIRKATTL